MGERGIALKLDRSIINWIERAFDFVSPYGEVTIIVHDGRVRGIDAKTRRRVAEHPQLSVRQKSEE